MEELGKKLDKLNRKKFPKEECDSVFIAGTEIIEDINKLKNGEECNFEDRLEQIKNEALQEEMLFASEEFDIFGTITEDKTKINTIGNAKHREIKKSKFRILEINKNTDNETYTNTLKYIIKELEKAMSNAEFGENINAFYASTRSDCKPRLQYIVY